MMARRRLSSREAWLVALVPASLVIMVAWVLPNGSGEAKRLRGVLAAVPSDEKMHKDMASLARTIREERQAIKALDETLASLQPTAGVGVAPSDAAPTASVAKQLERVGLGLQAHGVTLLSAASTGLERPASDRPRSAALTTWQLTLGSPWPQMQRAMQDAQAIPPGLWVTSLEMMPAEPGSPLRRWQLKLAMAGSHMPKERRQP